MIRDKKTPPPVNAGFHAFTFDGQTFGGYVQTFEDVEDIINFTYSYVEDGSNVVGSFSGEVNERCVKGAWNEIAKPPIDGVSSFSGGATLEMVESDGRRILNGDWTLKGAVTGRWIVEIGDADGE